MKLRLLILLINYVSLSIGALAMNQDSLAGRKLIDEAISFIGTDDDLMLQKLREANMVLKTNGPWELYVESFNGLYFYFKERNFQYDSAQKYANLAYQTALERLRPENGYYAAAANGKGVFLVQSGAYSKAKKHLEELLEKNIYDKVNKEVNLAKLLNSIGSCHKELGDYDEAIRYYERGLLLLKSSKKESKFILANQFNSLAKLYGEIGELEKAEEKYEGAIKTIFPIKEKHYKWIIDYHQSLTIIQIKNGKLTSALKNFGLSKTYQRIEPHFLYTNNKILSEYSLANQEYSKAIFHQEKFIHSLDSMFNTRPKHPNRVRGKLRLGEIHQYFNHYQEALTQYQQAISLLCEGIDRSDFFQNPNKTQTSYAFDLIPLLRLKAQSLFKWSKETDKKEHKYLALETYVLCMDMLEEVRAKFQSSKSQSLISAVYAESIEEALSLCFDLYSEEKDFSFLESAMKLMENNKASSLHASLKDLDAKKSLGLPDSVFQKEKAILQGLADLRSMIYLEESKKTERQKVLKAYREKLFQLQEDQKFFIKKLERNHPQYHQLKYSINTVALFSIQKKLPSDKVLIEYFWGKNHIYLLAIDRDKAYFSRIEHTEEINSILTSFRKRIKDGDWALDKGFERTYFQNFCRESFHLYQWFLEPVLEKFSDKNSLIIIPDGLLNYLPFESLITEESGSNAEIDYASLPYLIRKFPINYHYSASLFQKKYLSKSDETDIPILSIAPNYESGYSFPLHLERLITNSESRTGISPLAFNQDEASLIRQIWGGMSLLGADATESNFKSQAQNSQIIHLAMHAFSDDESPMNSGLVFNSPLSDEKDDAILYAHEIYNLKLKAKLAILSACNTGAGKLAEGEGVMSLARSFAYAGVPSTSMSLWRADDKSISQIMQSFHAYLHEGLEKSAAMRQAKLDFLDKSNLTHPYFWAAFMTIGDDEPIVSSPFPSRLMYALLIFVLGFISYWAIKSRSRSA